jgi:hypothetical protein
MATVAKSSKINFYKFVQVKEPSATAVKKSGGNIALTKSLNKNTVAINRIGLTLNSIAKVAVDLKKVALAQYEASVLRPSFDPSYTTPQKKQKEDRGGGLGLDIKTPGFLEGIMNLLGGIVKLAVGTTVLKWLGDPRNQQKIQNTLEVIKKVVNFIFKIAEFGVVNTINGLYDLLKDDATPLERVGGLFKALTGLGTLMLGLRWLKNPTRIITDFGNTLIFLHNNLIKGKRGLMGRAGALGLAVGVGFAGYKAYNYLKDGQTTATTADEGQEPQNKPEGFSKGGAVKVPQKAMGGWINGPQSGYPVSMDGGRSTAFIGHGREYVARKSNGGAFVIPFNTPGTKTQPHLTDKRLGEAKSQGFDIGGLVGGGFKPGKGFKNPIGDTVLPSYAPESKVYAQGGKIPGFANGGNLDKQIYLHWTASRHQWKAGPYHTTVQGDGTLYKHKPYDQFTAHTYYRNSGNVGLSIAAMRNWNWEQYGPTKPQLEALMGEAAVVAKGWGWKPSDVTIKRVMTHAECASNKDGRRPHDNYGPQFWNGTGERADLHKLKRNDPDGSGGDKLRQMMKKYMGMANPPLLKEVGPGSGGAGGGGSMNSSEYRLLQRLVIAEAGSEGKTGMALVARSVLNRAGLIQSGKVGPGMFGANDKSVTGVIMGPGQYQPVRDGSLNKPRSEQQMLDAKKAIELARNPAGLRGTLEAEGLQAGQINYLMGSTGFRTGSAFNDPSQNVNVVQYKNHFFNTAGNKDVKHHLAEIENGGTGGGYGAGDYGPSATNEGTSFGDVSKLVLGEDTSVPTASTSGYTYGNANRVGQSGRRANGAAGPAAVSAGSDLQTRRIQQTTDERNDARRKINERTREMMSAALEAVGQQNGMNAQMIAAAQQAIQQMQARSAPQQPQFIPSGGGISGSAVGGAIGGSAGAAIGGTAAAVLNSFNNPLKGIFR